MQYKFRGKRIPDNKWIYGSLLQWPDGECEIAELDSHKEGNKFMVKPETVGMSSGLLDVNNIEIWEGDIYNSIHGKGAYKVMIVNGAFVGGRSEQSCMPLAWDPNGEDDMIVKNPSWCKVIGNIHDNPELVTPADKTATI
jgi:uncharacterized phage protein (TIGR01671 family)